MANFASNQGSPSRVSALTHIFRFRHRHQTFYLGAGTFTVGRQSSCEVVLQDSRVSRVHARIIIGAQSAAIEDLRSSNGVKVNGKPISGLQRLAAGDTIEIGSQIIEVLGLTSEMHADELEATRTYEQPPAVSRHPSWCEEDARVATTIVPSPSKR
jgi:pSer/pThr/pTyr-binding forkhead associated (FHA) protein